MYCCRKNFLNFVLMQNFAVFWHGKICRYFVIMEKSDEKFLKLLYSRKFRLNYIFTNDVKMLYSQKNSYKDYVHWKNCLNLIFIAQFSKNFIKNFIFIKKCCRYFIFVGKFCRNFIYLENVYQNLSKLYIYKNIVCLEILSKYFIS